MHLKTAAHIIVLLSRTSQGFFNSIIFIWHKVAKYQRRNVTLSLPSALKMVFTNDPEPEFVVSNLTLVRRDSYLGRVRFAHDNHDDLIISGDDESDHLDEPAIPDERGLDLAVTTRVISTDASIDSSSRKASAGASIDSSSRKASARASINSVSVGEDLDLPLTNGNVMANQNAQDSHSTGRGILFSLNIAKYANHNRVSSPAAATHMRTIIVYLHRQLLLIIPKAIKAKQIHATHTTTDLTSVNTMFRT